MRAAVILVAFLLLLSACEQPRTPPDTTPNGAVQPSTQDSSGRPDIPRQNPPQDTPGTTYTNAGEQPHGPGQVFIQNVTPSTDLDVLLGGVIGDDHPFVTSQQFPLLKHPAIRVNNNLLIGYEERLTFAFGKNSTGRVTFTKDENTNEIGSFLRFEEGKQILAYSLHLDQGRFEMIQGRDIQILGHTYTIAEATNKSVTLYGKDVPNNLRFADGARLTVNSSTQVHTISSVTPDTISYQLFTEGPDHGDILLSPGESLSKNIGWSSLASLIFDITYQGAPVQNATHLEFAQTSRGFDLIADLVEGQERFPLVESDAGKLLLGSLDQPLRVAQCAGYCVAPDSLLVMAAADGRSFLLSYDGASERPNEIHFSDMNRNTYVYKYDGTPGVNATTRVTFGKMTYTVRVGPLDNTTGGRNISIDQRMTNGRAEIVLRDGSKVRVADPQNNSLQVTVTIPANSARQSHDESVVFNLALNGTWTVGAPALDFVEDQDAKNTLAQTQYGATVILDQGNLQLPLNTGKEALLLIPDNRVYGVVRLEG